MPPGASSDHARRFLDGLRALWTQDSHTSVGAIALVGLGGFLFGCFVCAFGALNRPPAEPRAAAVAPSAGAITIPEAQHALCETVATHAGRYKAASRRNELKRSQLRAGRGQALLETKPEADRWVGTLVSLGTTSEGKGIVTVKLACPDDVDITVHTWSMSITDVLDDTLLPPASSAYATLTELAPGARVVFSGVFLPTDPVSGWKESSLTEHGSMAAPEFLFRFTAVSRPDLP